MLLSSIDIERFHNSDKTDKPDYIHKNQEKEYKIAYVNQGTNKWPQLIVEMTVLCPQDYDGTVFIVRYADEETNAESTAFDWEGVHTIDELPYYNTVETFYFTKSDH